MSPRSQPSLPFDERKEKIKQLVATHDYMRIALICGVTERTIKRDVAAMKQSGEWTEWVEAELLRLFRDGEVSDTKKFEKLVDLYKGLMKERIEATIKVEADVEVTRKDDIDALLGQFAVLFPPTLIDAESAEDDDT